MIDNPQNKGGKQGINTFCNYAAAVISEEYGAPNLQYYKNIERNADAVETLLKNREYDSDTHQFENVTWEKAEDYASRGGLAVCVGSRHVATLTGGFGDNIKDKAHIKIYQAGARCGHITYGWAWTPTMNTSFYIWRKK